MKIQNPPQYNPLISSVANFKRGIEIGREEGKSLAKEETIKKLELVLKQLQELKRWHLE